MTFRTFLESSSDEIKNCQLIFSHLCSCKLKPVSMKLRDYVAIWSVDIGLFQASRDSYVLTFHQARHAYPTENLESRARAPRVWAGGTGRPRGRWLLLGVKPPRETEKSSSVEEEDTLPSIEAAAMKRKSWMIDMKRLKTGLQQVVRGL